MNTDSSPSQSLFTTIPVPLVIYNQQTVLEANDVFCRLFNCTVEEMVGKDAGTFLHTLFPPDLAVAMLTEQSGIYYTQELQCGSATSVKVTCVPFSYQDEIVTLMVIQDISKRQAYAEQVQQQHQFLANIIESLDMPFYVINVSDYTIQLANSAARQLGVSTVSTCYALTHRRDTPCDGLEHPCPLALIQRTNRPTVVNHIHYDKDGNTRDMEVHAYPLFNDAGKLTQMVEYSIDVTERNQAAARQMQLIHDLDAFAHTVAHDLKNPLSNVKGYSSFLSNNLTKLPNETVQEMVQYIDRGATKMNDIIEALLLLASIGKDSKPPPVQILNMGKIIAEVLQRLEPTIEQYAGKIILPDYWFPSHGYAPWIEQVWINYISNALKYGGKPPSIELGSEKLPHANLVRFWVRDNGKGLSNEQAKTVFEPFTRHHAGEDIEGHGLGLSIVKRAIQKLGGEVAINTKIGKGSEFSFTLPQEL